MQISLLKEREFDESTDLRYDSPPHTKVGRLNQSLLKQTEPLIESCRDLIALARHFIRRQNENAAKKFSSNSP
jgi:hypothetical protein